MHVNWTPDCQFLLLSRVIPVDPYSQLSSATLTVDDLYLQGSTHADQHLKKLRRNLWTPDRNILCGNVSKQKLLQWFTMLAWYSSSTKQLRRCVSPPSPQDTMLVSIDTAASLKRSQCKSNRSRTIQTLTHTPSLENPRSRNRLRDWSRATWHHNGGAGFLTEQPLIPEREYPAAPCQNRLLFHSFFLFCSVLFDDGHKRNKKKLKIVDL